MREKKTWWAKRKALAAIDKKIVDLSGKLKEATEYTDIMKIQHHIDTLVDLREKIKKPKVPKEVWVELLKVGGVALALGAVIKYDKDGNVLPQRLTNWIPKL